MLEYVYQLDYDDDIAERYLDTIGPVDPIVLNVRVYNIAEKYFIPGLKECAESKFRQRVKQQWDTPAFADSVRDVYQSCPRNDNSLRHTIRAVIKAHGATLGKNPFTYESLHATIHDVGDFAVDIFRALTLESPPSLANPTRRHRGEMTLQCPECDMRFRGHIQGLVRCPNQHCIAHTNAEAMQFLLGK